MRVKCQCFCIAREVLLKGLQIHWIIHWNWVFRHFSFIQSLVILTRSYTVLQLLADFNLFRRQQFKINNHFICTNRLISFECNTEEKCQLSAQGQSKWVSFFFNPSFVPKNLHLKKKHARHGLNARITHPSFEIKIHRKFYRIIQRCKRSVQFNPFQFIGYFGCVVCCHYRCYCCCFCCFARKSPFIIINFN